MQVLQRSAELSSLLQTAKQNGKKIGFVPTMGYLHTGHISLVKTSQKENDLTIVSIFVNPTQFGPQEDFNKYPRDLAHDKKLLTAARVDILFHPDVEDVYPKLKPTKKIIADPELTKFACGQSRPGHFDGVVTVVARLFDIVQPDRAYFGLKDYQQFLVIRKMSADLKYPIEIIGCPIIREPDGLAMSSRNKYLSAAEHEDALVLYRSLILAKNIVKQGEKDIHKIKNKIIENILKIRSARIDYVEILDKNNLTRPAQYQPDQSVLLLAVFIGTTRLIDNMFI